MWTIALAIVAFVIGYATAQNLQTAQINHANAAFARRRVL